MRIRCRFRPRRGAKDALRPVDQIRWKRQERAFGLFIRRWREHHEKNSREQKTGFAV
jgi:hypothetical protein